MIFIFLSCRENSHDNKEFRLENSKPRSESRFKTCKVKPCFSLNTRNNLPGGNEHLSFCKPG